MTLLVREFSDLHNEWRNKFSRGYELPHLDTDKETVLVLAGDVDYKSRAAKTYGDLHKKVEDPRDVSWLGELSERFAHVVYVFGNHDYWKENVDTAHDKLRGLLKDQGVNNVHVLERDSLEVEGVVFLGTTLWTDFYNSNENAINNAQHVMNDYKESYQTLGSRVVRLTASRTLLEHKSSVTWLKEELQKNENKPTVVVSHHAPSFRSIHPRYAHQGLTNSAYASDLEELIEGNEQVKFWFHGHVHDSFNYKVGNTQVVCNPYGYHDHEVNPKFDPVHLLKV